MLTEQLNLRCERYAEVARSEQTRRDVCVAAHV